LPPVNQTELLDTIAERTGITDFSLPEVIRSIEVQDINGGKAITVGIPDNTNVGKECIWNSTKIYPRRFKPTTVNASQFTIQIRFPNQELKEKCETELKKFRVDKFKEIKALSPELAANKEYWFNLFIDFLYTLPDVIEYIKNNPYTPVEWWTLFNKNLAKAAGTTCETTGKKLLPCLNPYCAPDCGESVVYKYTDGYSKNKKTYLMPTTCCKTMMNIRKDEHGNDVFDFSPFDIHGERCDGENGELLFVDTSNSGTSLTMSPNSLARLYPFLIDTSLGEALMEMDTEFQEKRRLYDAAYLAREGNRERAMAASLDWKRRKAAERFEAELERHKKEAKEVGDDSMSEENQARYWKAVQDAVLSFHKKYGRWPWIQVFDAAWENDWFRKEEQRCWLVDKSRKGSIVRKKNGNNFVPSELGKVEDVGRGRILLGVEVPKSCIVHLNNGFDSRNLETELILKCKKEWPDRTCNQVERAGNTDIQAKKLAARNGITYVQKKRVCAVMLVDLDRGINDGSIKLSPDRKKHIKDFMRLKKAWPDSMLDHDKISNY